MIKYNFDQSVNRRDLGSYKWNAMKAVLGEDAASGLAVSTADMDFVPIPQIVAAIEKAASLPIYGYNSPTEEYFESVISWMQRRFQWTPERNSIVNSPGIVASLYYVLYALSQPGDGVIIQTPIYRPFFGCVEATQRKIIFNPLINESGNYRIDFDDLRRKAALPEAKLMFLCSPHNPVARVWNYDELEQIAKICTENDVLVVSDEIHCDIVFPPHKHTVYHTLPSKWTKNSLVCTSPSKSFNLSGLQVSNIMIPDQKMRKAFTDAALHCGFHALNSFAVPATIAAYNECEAWLEQMLQYVHANDRFVRDFSEQHKLDLTISPLQGTYLQWIDFSAWNRYYLERENLFRKQAKVFFESGHIFGEDGKPFERFNLAYPRTTIEEVLKRIAAVR